MKSLTFIDLFAGIGGMRLAFTQAGARCVFSSEWNKFAQITYAANFSEMPAGDITQITTDEIPEHDILRVYRTWYANVTCYTKSEICSYF